MASGVSPRHMKPEQLHFYAPHNRAVRAQGMTPILHRDGVSSILVQSINGLQQEPSRQYGTGRVCACGTRLSRYNPTTTCSACASRNPKQFKTLP